MALHAWISKPQRTYRTLTLCTHYFPAPVDRRRRRAFADDHTGSRDSDLQRLGQRAAPWWTMSGTTLTLLEWLTDIELTRYHDAMVAMGCETLKFLLKMMEDEDIAGMCDDVGMKKLQKKICLKSVQKLRASAAAAAPAAPAPAPAPAPSSPAPAPSTKGQGEQSEVSVRVWLDVIKPGFGAKFSSAFEAAGLDLLGDLAGTDEGELAELEVRGADPGRREEGAPRTCGKNRRMNSHHRPHFLFLARQHPPCVLLAT